MVSEETGGDVRPKAQRMRTLIIGGVVAAALGGIVWLRPGVVPTFGADRRLDAAMRELVDAVGSQRFIEPRLTDPFVWGPPPSPVRGARPSSPPSVRIAALKVVENAGAAPGAAALRRVGVAYLVLNEPDKAIEALETAIELDPDAPQPHSDLSAALLYRWRAGGEAFDAVRVLEEAGAALARRPQSLEAAFNQALVLEYLGPKDGAIALWLKYLEADSTSRWAAEARTHVATLQQTTTRPALRAGAAATDARADTLVAEDAFAAYGLIETEALPRWAAAALEGRDEDLASVDRLASALARADKDAYPAMLTAAVRESRGWPDRRRRQLAEGIRDVFAWRVLIDDGNYGQAEPLGPRATLALKGAGVDAAEAELETAYSDLSANRTDKALARLAPLEHYAREHRYWRVAAKSARLRALAAMLDTRVSEAQERYQDALTLAERSGDVELAAVFHSSIGEALDVQGDMVSSWRHFAAALKELPRFRTERQRFVTLQSAAAAATRGGLQEATLVFAEALLSVTRSWDNPEGQITGRLYRARALAELSREDRGVADLDEASSRLASLANRPQGRNRLAAEIAARRSYSLSGQHDAAALKAADEALAFFGSTVRIRIAELLLQRGRIHMRLGHNADATKDWLRGISIVEDQRPSLRDEMLRVSRTASLWDLYTEVLNESTSDGRRALEIAERSHARELLFSLNPERDPQTLSLADWQQALSGGRQAIVYAQLPSRLLVWRVTATEVELTEQPVSARQLRQAVTAFISHLDAGPASPDAIALAHTLLPRNLKYDSTQPLIIVPTGVLYRMPFAALPVPGSGKRLAESVIPIVAPSLTTFVLASRHERTIGERSVLAVGVADAAPAEDLPRLTNAETEAVFVSSLYDRRQPLTGRLASKPAVLEAMTSHSVIHFAGHARLDPLFPERSRLVLRDGDSLMPPEIAALKLQPGTVAVLGACETALGRTFNGEGAMSLVRAFLGAGASAVVAALWDVRDDEATRLLRSLHTRLSAGADLASSLAASQRELIAAGFPPSAWSGFTVVGGMNAERVR
jgi:CHAT domain-containing protein/Tfp pilus assembly protein PilF